MPAIAAVAATAAASASAAGAAAMTALGGLTLTGLATGATIVGTGMQVVSAITGNKTLGKIGLGFSVAGGLGMGASALSGMSNASRAASVTGNVSKTGGLLSSADDIATAGTSAKAASEGLKTFSASKGTSSADKFKASANSIGSGSVSGSSALNPGTQMFDPELEKSYFQRANMTLTQYNPMMNMLGGMGEAYMMNERMDMEKGIADKRIGIDQQALDLQKQKQDFMIKNNSAPSLINPTLNLARDTSAYTGLLGR